MLPKGWRSRTVADICEFQNGHGFGPEDWGDQGLPIIRIQNMNGGKNFDYYAGKVDPKWVVDTGTLLFAWAGTRGVSFGPSIWRGPTGVLNQHIFKVTPKEGVDPEWLFSALRFVTDRIERNAHGFKATLLHVKKSDIERQVVLVPPAKQQRSIEVVLSIWDEAIVTSEAVLANLRHQKAGLLRRLFKRRRNNDPAHASWTYVDLDQVFERITRKNTPGNTNVLTISGEHGLISQREYFKKSVASANLAGYTLLRHGEYAYNKSYSAGYPMGAIKPLTRYEAGVVSSLYVCFRFRDGIEADRVFFRHYFEAGLLNDELTGIAQEGARNHGLLNVGVGDFFKLRLHIPAVEEQRRIASILNAAESEERLVSEQIRILRDEKQALMQQLLTGKRRVHLPEAAAAASP